MEETIACMQQTIEQLRNEVVRLSGQFTFLSCDLLEQGH
jgi:hypothetical protein